MNKRKFDVTSIEDVQEFLEFRKSKNWANVCPFTLEWPYNDVPTMIVNKLIDVMTEDYLNRLKAKDNDKKDRT